MPVLRPVRAPDGAPKAQPGRRDPALRFLHTCHECAIITGVSLYTRAGGMQDDVPVSAGRRPLAPPGHWRKRR